MKHFGRRLHDRIVGPVATVVILVGAVSALSAVVTVGLITRGRLDPWLVRAVQALAVVWSLGAVAVIGLVVTRSGATVARPLRDLADRAARIAAGDFDGTAPDATIAEIADLARSIELMGDALRERTDSLSRKVVELSTLREVSRSAGRAGELEPMLDSMLDAAMRLLDADRGYVVLDTADSGPAQVRSTFGCERCTTATISDSPASWVLAEGRPLLLNATGGPDEVVDGFSGARAAIAVPLTGADGVSGALVVGAGRAGSTFRGEDVRVLATIGNQMALAADNARLVTTLQESYVATVRSLAAAVDAKDHYTRGHSDRVAAHAGSIARQLDLGAEQQTALEVASYLHDIGKIGIPEAILGKPGKLDEAEYAHMKEHPTIGAGILGQVAFPWPVAPIVRHHHERWDGKGYPTGLAGEDIPPLARLLSVADAFEAMTSDRPYRRGCDPVAALSELRRHSGTQFDSDIVDAFEIVLEREGYLLAGAPQVAAVVSPVAG